MAADPAHVWLKEYLNSANITEDDLDYYLNYTSRLANGGLLDGEMDYCGMGLRKIRRSVRLIHGCLSLVLCLAGCLANILNIIVLSQKELSRAPINRILCGLAVADFLLMFEYIPFACHMYLFPVRSLQSFYSYPWAAFVLFHAHFTLVCHTVSIWLTLSLAFWRYEVLKSGRGHRKNQRSQRRCLRTIVTAYIGSVILCIPSFVTYGIEQKEIQDPSTITIYIVDLNTVAKQYDGLVHKAHLWTYSVLMKLGPCLILTVLTCWLLKRLWEAEKHHQSLAPKLVHSSQIINESIGREKKSRDINNEQVSVTQQLEMRHLTSAMKRESKVQIIVTEASVNLDQDHITPMQLKVNPGQKKTSSIQDDCSGDIKIASLTSSAVVVDPPSPKNLSATNAPLELVTDDDNEAVAQPARLNVVAHSKKPDVRHRHQTDRTTRMLVIILLLFLVTEIPQGIMALLSGIWGHQFFTHCYSGMGEILDLVALLNSAVNFLLYCSMSRQFRTQFRRLFTLNYVAAECFIFHRKKKPVVPQLNNVSPSNPTRCTHL